MRGTLKDLVRKLNAAYPAPADKDWAYSYCGCAIANDQVDVVAVPGDLTNRTGARSECYAVVWRYNRLGAYTMLDAIADIAYATKTGQNSPLNISQLGRPTGNIPIGVGLNKFGAMGGFDRANVYPYTAGQNNLSSIVPPWAHDGGNVKLLERLQDRTMRARIRKDMLTPTTSWDNEWQEIGGPHDVLITAVNNPSLLPIQGKRLDEIAAMWHEDAINALFDILVKDSAQTSVAVFGMSEPDVRLALTQPWVSVDNDASGTSPEGILGQEHPHPRAYATFPRILRKYVHDEHLLTLPDAIRKFTALAAQREHLVDRGVIKRGMWADLVVFDPDSVRDVATYEKPNQLSVGMRWVLVNGVPVIADGRMTGAKPGRILYGPGYRGSGD